MYRLVCRFLHLQYHLDPQAGSPKDICTGGEGSQARVQPLVVVVVVVDDAGLAVEQVEHGGQRRVDFRNYIMAPLVVDKGIVVLGNGGSIPSLLFFVKKM